MELKKIDNKLLISNGNLLFISNSNIYLNVNSNIYYDVIIINVMYNILH